MCALNRQIVGLCTTQILAAALPYCLEETKNNHNNDRKKMLIDFLSLYVVLSHHKFFWRWFKLQPSVDKHCAKDNSKWSINFHFLPPNIFCIILFCINFTIHQFWKILSIFFSFLIFNIPFDLDLKFLFLKNRCFL